MGRDLASDGTFAAERITQPAKFVQVSAHGIGPDARGMTSRAHLPLVGAAPQVVHEILHPQESAATVHVSNLRIERFY